MKLSPLALALQAGNILTHIAKEQQPLPSSEPLHARTTKRSPADQKLAYEAAAVRRAMREQRNLLRAGKTGKDAL